MKPATPEHLQLFSDKRLKETAELSPESEEDETQRQGRKAISRAARYELARRRCEIPVRDRYGA